MTSQQESTDKSDLESTATVDVDVIDLGDAKVETKQIAPIAWFKDNAIGHGFPG